VRILSHDPCRNIDVEEFKTWLDAAQAAGIVDKTAVLASVFPLESAEEAEQLCDKYTEFQIPAGNYRKTESSRGIERPRGKRGWPSV
jgi:5,10-methylenetetrahydrofolate reductase